MSNFKTMKIRVNDSNRAAVKAALLAEGYEPVGVMTNLPIYDVANGYYTYGDDSVLCSTVDGSKNHMPKDYFDAHENPEYILTQQGTLVPAEAPAEKTYEPLPLMPKADHDFNRMCEIVSAIQRYLEAENRVPQEWLDEFSALNNQQGGN